jgi:hypothetical protein
MMPTVAVSRKPLFTFLGLVLDWPGYWASAPFPLLIM